MNRPALALVVVTLLAMVGTSLYGQAQSQNQPPTPARSRSDEMLDRWNDIGNKLIAMAQDFPEDKYDFKVQKDERTFALNLLHAAALDFVLIRRISGSGRRRRSEGDSTAGRCRAEQYKRKVLATGWPSTCPFGRSPSSTAASTMASL